MIFTKPVGTLYVNTNGYLAVILETDTDSPLAIHEAANEVRLADFRWRVAKESDVRHKLDTARNLVLRYLQRSLGENVLVTEWQGILKDPVKETSPSKECNRSDGSTASYYQLPEDAKELQDLISHRNMNAQLGEIFRACYRFGTASHSDQLRDAKKIKFYIDAEIKRLEGNGN